MDLNLNMQHLLAAGQPPNGWIWALAIGFTAICLIMMLVVLIQKPKGGGLSGAFGGGAGGGSESAFIGGRVGDVLTWVTVVCFVLFLLLAMGMTWTIKGGGDELVDDEDTEQVEGEEDATAEGDDTAAGAGLINEEDVDPESEGATPETTDEPTEGTDTTESAESEESTGAETTETP